MVQMFPSLHGTTGKAATPQTPAPSQVLLVVHTFPSSQGCPAGSNVHVGEQQSPATLL